MNFKKIFILIWMSMLSINTEAHVYLNGFVYEKEAPSVTIPSAVVRFPTLNIFAVTDTSGHFSIEIHADLPLIAVVSCVGFTNDTLTISEEKPLKLFLKKSIELKSIEINGKRDALVTSTIQPLNVERITEVELLKAACCNLSEAFETNPVISVAYKDAVTGAKEIQLLGLSGIYSQLLTENIPNMQGIAGIYGLTFIPGPWMESIQLTKGSGSVVNGYESTTGLINVEFKKPLEKTTPKFYLNLFADEHQSLELNTFYKKVLSKKASTMFMVHGRLMDHALDNNTDGFADSPTNRQVNLYNRWQVQLNRRVEAQFGIKYLVDKSDGGQIGSENGGHTIIDAYKTKVETQRAEAYGKVGIVYPKRPQMSVGNIIQFTYHDMNSNFGLKIYDATEKTVYLQSIFQNYFIKLNHEYKVGINYRYNEVSQLYQTSILELAENIPGVFFEYTYSYLDKFKLIAGAREDYHFEDGWVLIPRLHLKYNFSENSIVRLSVGSSYRRPYIFADHISVFATSRKLIVDEKIEAERAVNYGINYTQKFQLVGKPASFNIDLYKTDFSQQLITDMYSDKNAIHFYNLNGKSFSNSFQVSFNAEVINHLDVRLAFKTDDVKNTYQGKLLEVPLVTRSRGLVNLAYEYKRRHLKFDYTIVLEGKKKLQEIANDKGEVKTYSPAFILMNTQLTKEFKRISYYVGVENFLNFKQDNPIVSSQDPFSSKFDATNIWGPIAGRRIYVGLRFSLK